MASSDHANISTSHDEIKAPLADTKETVMGDDDHYDSDSIASSIMACSEVSSAPDRYGFLGGAQYSEDGEERIPVDVIRGRETKWMEMLKHWDDYMARRYRKVRDRCRKGIPSSMRARAWQKLCGADKYLVSEAGTFDRLAEVPLDDKTDDEIRKDLHRQFPHHEMFLEKGGHGQEDLYKVLKVHAMTNKDSYCQAQAPLAAVLLMQMPAEPAFWCLRIICDKYLTGYYACDLEAIQIDGEILYKLLKKVSPSIYKHIKKQKIEPVLYMTEWFMCVFSRTLPWSSVLRVWDMFFCEGVKVLFRVGLVLLKYGLRPEVVKKCPSMYETVQALRNIETGIMAQGFLLFQMNRLNITEEDLKREHERQVKKRHAQKDLR